VAKGQNDTLAHKSSRRIIRIAAEKIKVIKKPDPATVSSLEKSISHLGLLHPPIINAQHEVVTGAARVTAAQNTKAGKILVTILPPGVSATKQEVVALHENLVRKMLSAGELCRAVARFDELNKKLFPAAGKKGGDHGNQFSGGKSPKDHHPATAKLLSNGKPSLERTYQSYLALNNKLLPAVDDYIRSKPIWNNRKELIKLATLGPPEQLAIAKLISTGEARHVEHAQRVYQRAQLKKAAAPHNLKPLEKPLVYRAETLQEKVALLAEHGAPNLFFTDPEWREDSLYMFSELEELVQARGADDCHLLCGCGSAFLDEVIYRLCRLDRNPPWLKFRGIICLHFTTPIRVPRWTAQFHWLPVLMFTKACYNASPYTYPNFFDGCGPDHRLHQWGMPVTDVAWFIKRFSPENALVCDPYAGAGSTAIAALTLGRRFIGFEKDQVLVDLANNRVALFLATGKDEWQPETTSACLPQALAS
jgi:hypothetical protein